jgi:hypothetical protein
LHNGYHLVSLCREEAPPADAPADAPVDAPADAPASGAHALDGAKVVV